MILKKKKKKHLYTYTLLYNDNRKRRVEITLLGRRLHYWLSCNFEKKKKKK